MGPWKEIAWTKEEMAVLRELYVWSSRREVMEKLPKRFWSVICCKASTLKIRRIHR